MGEVNFRIIGYETVPVNTGKNLEEIAIAHGTAMRLCEEDIARFKEFLISKFSESEEKIVSDAYFKNRFANKGYLPDGSVKIITDYLIKNHPEEYKQASNTKMEQMPKLRPVNWDNRNESGYFI